MIRRVVVRLVAWLLILNGIAGIVAVGVGWRTTVGLFDSLHQSSALVSGQQASLVTSIRGVAVGVDDASQATAGVSRSTTQVRSAVNDATRTADQLAATFDQLSRSSQVTLFGVRPLEGLIQSFQQNSADFRQLSVALGQTADSLAANAQEMTRVSEDLQGIQGQVSTTATEIEALQSAELIQQGLAGLELGSRLLLGLLFFEATLSALTGFALLMVIGHPHLHRPALLAILGAKEDDQP
jgi:hypothetical protein